MGGTAVPAGLVAAKERALARVSDLEREAEAIAEATAGAPDDEHDPEGSTVGFERARVQFLLTQAREQLSAIEGALADARDGRYGRCERCGAPIGAARIAALPATRRCLRCASV